jgi:hypothetical protein
MDAMPAHRPEHQTLDLAPSPTADHEDRGSPARFHENLWGRPASALTLGHDRGLQVLRPGQGVIDDGSSGLLLGSDGGRHPP